MQDHQHLPSPLTPPTPTLRCPRCDSPNTKFCYYNNYNLSQPRHFCKSCRRYWTKGGALRNVPVGGASRKPKRPSPPSSRPSRPPKSRKVHPDSSAEDDDRRSGSETSNFTTVMADGNLTWGLSGDENACVFADLWADGHLSLMDHPTGVDFPPILRADWPGIGLSDVMGSANVDLLGWNEGQWGEGEPSFLFLP